MPKRVLYEKTLDSFEARDLLDSVKQRMTSKKCLNISSPTVTKISNPSTESSTQNHRRNVHAFEVKTQTWCWVLTWGNLVTAVPDWWSSWTVYIPVHCCCVEKRWLSVKIVWSMNTGRNRAVSMQKVKDYREIFLILLSRN